MLEVLKVKVGVSPDSVRVIKIAVGKGRAWSDVDIQMTESEFNALEIGGIIGATGYRYYGPIGPTIEPSKEQNKSFPRHLTKHIWAFICILVYVCIFLFYKQGGK
jgi:hypothetical protein